MTEHGTEDLSETTTKQMHKDDAKRRKAIQKLVTAGSGECHSTLVTALEEISDNCRRAEEGEMEPEMLIDSIHSWLDSAYEALSALESFLPTGDGSAGSYLTESAHISPQTYAGMTKIAMESTAKQGMQIDVDACVEVACKNSIAERSGSGRIVVLREQ